MDTHRRQSRLIFYLIFIYILASFSWWSVLFLRQNQRAFRQDAEELRMAWSARGGTETGLEESAAYQALASELRKKNMMIIGEGLVFLSLISVGFWRINTSFNREIQVSRQQNNFLLSITHELKSPLASIKLAMETLQRRELQNDQVNRIASRSLDDVDRLEKMVENILLASKMEDPGYRFDQYWFDLSSVIGEVALGIKRRYPEQQLQTAIQSGLHMNGDALAMSSVVLNLLDNAMKYAAPGTEVALSLHQANDQLVLEVLDRGPGIPDHEKGKVFQRFYRIGNEETRSSKGTGLGLFIVQEIVKAHGGHIQLKDRQGGGSVFSISLPASQVSGDAEFVLPADGLNA